MLSFSTCIQSPRERLLGQRQTSLVLIKSKAALLQSLLNCPASAQAQSATRAAGRLRSFAPVPCSITWSRSRSEPAIAERRLGALPAAGTLSVETSCRPPRQFLGQRPSQHGMRQLRIQPLQAVAQSASASLAPAIAAVTRSLSMELALTCLLLFVGALAAGALPLIVPISDNQLGVAAAFSAGLLIGAGLSVVVPEGFESFHTAATEGYEALPDGLAGAALLLGFLAMLFLDQLQGNVHAHKMHTSPHTSSDEDGEAPLVSRTPSHGRSRVHHNVKGTVDSGTRALVGLLIHSLADGLAVGAAMHGGNARLSAAVAFAMVLHKAPAALGLSTFLIAAHWSKIRAVRALVAFAAASPVAAVVTAVLLGLSPFLSHPAGAALCVIFSGGTFLYAACVHVLPEAREAGPGGSLSRTQLAAMALGSLLPLAIPFYIGGHH